MIYLNKLLIVVIISLFLASCDSYWNHGNSDGKIEISVITEITDTDNRYTSVYRVTTYGSEVAFGSVSNYKYKHISFIDSIGKFDIGDTVIFSKK